MAFREFGMNIEDLLTFMVTIKTCKLANVMHKHFLQRFHLVNLQLCCRQFRYSVVETISDDVIQDHLRPLTLTDKDFRALVTGLAL